MREPDETPGEAPILARRDRDRAVPVELGHVRTGDLVGDYRLVEPLGRGGMGQVWVAEQLSLGRRVALKLVLPERLSETTLALFAREARAGGRLAHRGIVTVHEHGEAEGLAWIAMELVEDAWTLREALDELAREEELPDGYYRHAAGFVAELADALEAAHRAGVIHRDLKPSNVLVTPEDHPKLTDFGLARITDESALSRTGNFAGTYYYMSPEQVAANRIGLDHRTDVFSLGVVMYEMLALRRPFEGDTAQQIGYQILQKDPPDLVNLRSRIPRDLAVICGKCLEKDREHRYATMAALAADVRRHLAHEPIVARPPGRLRRFQLWALRNPAKSLSGAVAAVAFVAIAVLLGANVRANRALELTVDERDGAIASLSTRTAELEHANEVIEEERNNLAEEVAAVKRLSALQDYDDLIARVDRLWPPHPERIEACEQWIDDARSLLDDLPLHYAKRDQLRALASPQTDEAGTTTDWDFSGGGRESAWWHANLSRLIDSLEDLVDSGSGLLSEGVDAVSVEHGWSVPRRLALAERLRDELTGGGEWSRQWEQTTEAIRRHEAYGGLTLPPQVGLVPVGPDPESGLWEFWHLATGEEPLRGEDGNIALTQRTGLVLVLIPGGSFLMGAQPTDPAGWNYDPAAEDDEGEVHEVRLAAFFLSKYEMTQGQWLRATGINPSFHVPASPLALVHPVEQVSWHDCGTILQRMGLVLPTEAQWEYAARGGTDTPWWTGEKPALLSAAANVADQTAKRSARWPEFEDWSDGHVLHAPVGEFDPNPFGLHSVHGNLLEWCRDEYGGYHLPVRPGDGERPVSGDHSRINRGGCLSLAAVYARSAYRSKSPAEGNNYNLGVRPARAIVME